MNKLVVFIVLIMGFGLAITFYFVGNDYYQLLDNGELMKVGKNEVFISQDNTTYTFKPQYKELLDYFREHNSNVPEILKERCGIEN